MLLMDLWRYPMTWKRIWRYEQTLQYQIEDKVTGAVLEADWLSEKWAQRRADWMNYKEEEKHEQNKV